MEHCKEYNEIKMVLWACAQILKSLEKGRKKHGTGTWEGEKTLWHLTKSARHALTAMCELEAGEQPDHVKRNPHYQDGETHHDHLQCALARAAMANFILAKPRLYVAGPMTGLPEYNYPAFHAATWDLEEGHEDWEVVNPASHYNGNTSLPKELYMLRDILEVLTCDKVVLLPGWQDSEGARVEHIVAKATGKQIEEYDGIGI